MIEFLKVELAAITIGFLATIWVTSELTGAKILDDSLVDR